MHRIPTTGCWKIKLLFRTVLTVGLWFSVVANAADAHLGVWSGTLTEVIVAGQQYQQYAATLTVTPQEYRIDYDTLSCGGILRLLKHKGRFYHFRDELDYGLKKCANGGRTEVHFISTERAIFQWFDKQGTLKVEGHLKRQPQLMI